MADIILHHYPQSPVTEKVRIGLGIKRLAWRSVEVPRIPPKPDLMPLTGGYRRAPVMQIGADIYCDSQCILRELQRRFPEPTVYPGGADGMAWGISRWTDGELMDLVVGLVLGAAHESLPPEFAADRGRDREVVPFVTAVLLANVVLYTVGAMWLAHVIGLPMFGSEGSAWALGIRPFLAGDLVKMIAAGLLFPAVWRFIDER